MPYTEKQIHMLKYEKNNKNILRPLSALDLMITNQLTSSFYLETNNMQNHKIGLALCHGHMHKINTLSKIKSIDYWYMVDNNNITYPDYVCDITNVELMKYFPDNYFDVTLSVYCNMDINIKNYFAIINRITKLKGYYVSTEFPALAFWTYKSNDTQIIINIINKYIDNKTMVMLYNKYKNECGFPNHFDVTFMYPSIIGGNFEYESKSIVIKKINKFNLQCTKKLLKQYNFKFIMIKNKLLISQKVK